MNRLAIIAGAGDVPYRLAQRAAENKQDFFVIALAGSADAGLYTAMPHAVVDPLTLSELYAVLAQAQCDAITFAGKLTYPRFDAPPRDVETQKFMARLNTHEQRGDNQMLELLCASLEARGLTIIAPEQIMPELLAPKGLLCGTLDETHKSDITLGVRACAMAGALDMGQCAIVVRGVVLAVEGAEGTDALLARVADLPQGYRGDAQSRAGVLVKLPKPQQNRLIDLPGLGVATISMAVRAGLAGIVYEAGGALLFDIEAMRSAAQKEGMFLFGLTHDE